MNVIALHGDYGTPEMLRADMGDPDWVTTYFNGRGWRYFDKSFDRLKTSIQDAAQPVVLVGFSRGGSVIAKLSKNPSVNHLIRAAVLYESPVKDSDGCGGKFPVLSIWNDRGAIRRLHRLDDVLYSIRCWSIGRSCEIMIGNGKHMELSPPGHSWDRSLNSRIENWIAQIESLSSPSALA